MEKGESIQVFWSDHSMQLNQKEKSQREQTKEGTEEQLRKTHPRDMVNQGEGA